MKTRDFRKRRVGCYGSAWERVRRLPCFWLRVYPGHRCGIGHTGGHTAHHYVPVGRGGRDQDGLLPLCGMMHSSAHGAGPFTLPMMEATVLNVLGKTMEEFALEYSRGGECGYDLED